MTENESRLYELADDAWLLAAGLEHHLHIIRYDPENATEEDIQALQEIKELVGKAARIAKQTSERMFGYSE